MNISSLYIDSVRVFMEYIDNSIDAAENENSLMVNLIGEDIQYKNKVEIKISISGKYYNTGKIKISDNAAGIKELRNVVEKIGNSEKKSQAWLNGQFGYGIYSFLAICDTLEILTKHSDNIYSEYIKITRSDFMIDDLNDLRFEIVTEHPHTPTSGTEITLS
ncbi:MAG TPA: ATP-binding protein, partial [Ignavibacteria bacterium]